MTRRAPLTMLLAVAVAAAALAPAAASAQSVPCATVAAYPGDNAPKPTLAAWMAYGASLAATPRELPVMGALVESAMQNLPNTAGSDAVGYFHMRLSIWNSGQYAGYLDNPALQLRWFLDQAANVRATRIAAGGPDPAADENAWGDWVADVLRPVESMRYRYQQRLADARTLIGPPCTVAGAPPPASPPPAPPPRPLRDTTPPLLRVGGARNQRALAHGSFVLRVACPGEPCTTSAAASIALPGARAPRIVLRSRALAAGQKRRLRFALTRSTRARLARALRSRRAVTATVRIVARDLAGNEAARTRGVRLTG